jgi:flagellar biosynthesis/type III secretory pathway protein FliH
MNPIMNAVKEKEHEDTEITYLIQLGMERESKERQALEKKYTEQDLYNARVEAYESGLHDGFAEAANKAYNKGLSEGYDQGFKSGYAEAKAMRALCGEGE